MNCVCCTRSLTPILNSNSVRPSTISSSRFTVAAPQTLIKGTYHSFTVLGSRRRSNPPRNEQEQQLEGEEDPRDAHVQDLRVPHLWLDPSRAFQEAEWLRITLHKWLDDEYCPEPTNVEISKIAARSFYTSLLEKKTDLGEILLKMARDLESISYQESFHGAFSSANAAINLIVQRIEQA